MNWEERMERNKGDQLGGGDANPRVWQYGLCEPVVLDHDSSEQDRGERNLQNITDELVWKKRDPKKKRQLSSDFI